MHDSLYGTSQMEEWFVFMCNVLSKIQCAIEVGV